MTSELFAVLSFAAVIVLIVYKKQQLKDNRHGKANHNISYIPGI
jgi:hypothetical protein